MGHETMERTLENDADEQMQLILSREALEPMHVHWMTSSARHEYTMRLWCIMRAQ